MGGITLVETPAEPEGKFALGSALYRSSPTGAAASVMSSQASSLGTKQLDQLALVDSADLGLVNASAAAAAAATTTAANSVTSFMTDFIVPSLQTRVWEDWQEVPDESTTVQDYMLNKSWLTLDQGFQDSNGLQLGLEGLYGNTAAWGSMNSQFLGGQAYDELVFDMPTFDIPTTVNTADLLVGSHSNSASVSPLELTVNMDANYNDLALANLYGFTDQSMADFDRLSNDADGSEDEDQDDEDEDQDGDEDENSEDVDDDEGDEQDHDPLDCGESTQFQRDLDAALAMSLSEANMTSSARVFNHTPQRSRQSSLSSVGLVPSTPPVPLDRSSRTGSPSEDSNNKRLMEEALVARIQQDLGPEHMAGLFRILKGQQEDDFQEDEELEVDLACLEETTLVELYQYVESCCMKSMGSILAAQDRERAQLQKDREEEEARVRQYQVSRRPRRDSTPELSFSGSDSHPSSLSPSPPHFNPQYQQHQHHHNQLPTGNAKNAKKANPSKRPLSTSFQGEAESVRSLMETNSKTKRKRNNGSTGIGGGGGAGSGKGRRIGRTDSDQHLHSNNSTNNNNNNNESNSNDYDGEVESDEQGRDVRDHNGQSAEVEMKSKVFSIEEKVVLQSYDPNQASGSMEDEDIDVVGI